MDVTDDHDSAVGADHVRLGLEHGFDSFHDIHNAFFGETAAFMQVIFHEL